MDKAMKRITTCFLLIGYTVSFCAAKEISRAIECAATTITNGVGTTGTTAFNGVHTFSCNAGYVLSGTAALTCDGTETNNWSAALPTCVGVDIHEVTAVNTKLTESEVINMVLYIFAALPVCLMLCALLTYCYAKIYDCCIQRSTRNADEEAHFVTNFRPSDVCIPLTSQTRSVPDSETRQELVSETTTGKQCTSDSPTGKSLSSDSLTKQMSNSNSQKERGPIHNIPRKPVLIQDSSSSPNGAKSFVDSSDTPVSFQESSTEMVQDSDSPSKLLSIEDSPSEKCTSDSPTGKSLSSGSLTRQMSNANSELELGSISDSPSKPLLIQGSSSGPVSIPESLIRPVSLQESPDGPVSFQKSSTEMYKDSDSSSKALLIQDSLVSPMSFQDSPNESDSPDGPVSFKETSTENDPLCDPIKPVLIQNSPNGSKSTVDSPGGPVSFEESSTEMVLISDSPSKPVSIYNSPSPHGLKSFEDSPERPVSLQESPTELDPIYSPIKPLLIKDSPEIPVSFQQSPSGPVSVPECQNKPRLRSILKSPTPPKSVPESLSKPVSVLECSCGPGTIFDSPTNASSLQEIPDGSISILKSRTKPICHIDSLTGRVSIQKRQTNLMYVQDDSLTELPLLTTAKCFFSKSVTKSMFTSNSPTESVSIPVISNGPNLNQDTTIKTSPTRLKSILKSPKQKTSAPKKKTRFSLGIETMPKITSDSPTDPVSIPGSPAWQRSIEKSRNKTSPKSILKKETRRPFPVSQQRASSILESLAVSRSIEKNPNKTNAIPVKPPRLGLIAKSQPSPKSLPISGSPAGSRSIKRSPNKSEFIPVKPLRSGLISKGQTSPKSILKKETRSSFPVSQQRASSIVESPAVSRSIEKSPKSTDSIPVKPPRSGLIAKSPASPKFILKKETRRYSPVSQQRASSIVQSPSVSGSFSTRPWPTPNSSIIPDAVCKSPNKAKRKPARPNKPIRHSSFQHYRTRSDELLQSQTGPRSFQQNQAKNRYRHVRSTSTETITDLHDYYPFTEWPTGHHYQYYPPIPASNRRTCNWKIAGQEREFQNADFLFYIWL